jgi:hypothetical protein
MIDSGPRTRTVAALLLAASLGVPPLPAASAQGTGFAPSGLVLAVGLFDFLGAGRRLRAKLADAQRRQAQAESEARDARADAVRAQADLARERVQRERDRAQYARALTHLAAYGRDADDQRAQVAHLQAQLEQETAIARALRRRAGAGDRSLADVTPVAPLAAPKHPVLEAPAQRGQGKRHRRSAPTSVGWGAI